MLYPVTTIGSIVGAAAGVPPSPTQATTTGATSNTVATMTTATPVKVPMHS
jgi:hypothetical protein